MKTSSNLKIRSGNLFDFPADVIFHQCNCFCTMGGGIALSIAHRFPEAKLADDQTQYGDSNKLGSFSFAKVRSSSDFQYIFNLYGQFSFSKVSVSTDYSALETALEKALSMCDCLFKKSYSVSIPYLIGCGLAGGKEEKVLEILEKVLESHKNACMTAYKL